MEDRSRYSSLLGRRYGKQMSPIFSDDYKYNSWRKCWIALAEAQCELGLANVKTEHVAQLKQFANDINYSVAEAKEKENRQDVMAHVYAFGKQCPEAAGILHAGATSCEITDNTEMMQMHDGLDLIKSKLSKSIELFGNFAMAYKDLACLAFTHYQPAQPTTVGKRAAMWAQNYILDYHYIKTLIENKKLRGLKGTTGTQASFLALADGDEGKVKELNKRFLIKLGYEKDFLITGQTYPRKYDSFILGGLSGIGESAHKFGCDVRLLQNRKEFEEPFEVDQDGSSAMPYKRNPMRVERMCGLSRGLWTRELESRMTAGLQWLERTLDDSAPRRDYIPQDFIAADEVLNLTMNVMERPVLYPLIIRKNLDLELPFMVTENILMGSVKKGKDRQAVHSIIKKYSQETGNRIKLDGADNNLLELLSKDDRIGLTLSEIKSEIDLKRLAGMASAQVEEFYYEEIEPLLKNEKESLKITSDVQV